MTPHRTAPLPLALLVAASLLTACSGSDGGQSEDTPLDAGAGDDAGGPGHGDASSDTSADAGPNDGDQGGPDLPRLVIPRGCNPLAPRQDCLLPFPSDVFMVEDRAMPNGRRLELPDIAKLETRDARVFDFATLHPTDGASPLPPILALLPTRTGIDGSGLVFHDSDPERTTRGEGPTLLLDADTGEPALHFAELDPRAEGQPDRQALVIRPMVRLSGGHRYVVAIRGLHDRDGSPIEAPEGFRRLRDGQASTHPRLQALQAHYEAEIFPALEAAGWHRQDLLLAWDFTVRSDEQVTRDMFRVRSLLLDWLQAHRPEVEVTEVAEPGSDRIARRIEATMTIPLYLEAPDPDSLLHRDESGQVTQNGTVEVPFTVQIPDSVFDGEVERPARIIQFGHGFFGSRREAEGGFCRQFADDHGFVLAATDWWGMSEADVLKVLWDMGNQPGDAFRFTDRLHQGMANFIALGYVLQHVLPDMPEVQLDGATAYDPSHVYFYGISQGHILGGTFLALSPIVERAVLGSGGSAFSFMMFRSKNFISFLNVIANLVPDPLDQQKYVALCQTSMDRIDPIVYAPWVTGRILPGGPQERRVLMQIGIGDFSVPNLAAHIHARSMGIPLLHPTPRELPGFSMADYPHDGSGLVEFDYGLEPPLPGDQAIPPEEENQIHQAVRRSPEGQAQIDGFFRPGGLIENHCDGACDPG